MAAPTVTLLFRQADAGWSEHFAYSPLGNPSLGDIQTEVMKTGGLFELRRALLASSVAIKYIRISDANVFGDIKATKTSGTQGQNPAAIPLPTTWAPSAWWNTLEYTGYSGAFNRRQIWLGGLPAATVSTTPEGVPFFARTFGAFETALSAYHAYLLNGSWGFLGNRAGPTQPEVSILELGAGTPVTIKAPAGAFEDEDEIRLRRPRGTNWPHGHWLIRRDRGAPVDPLVTTWTLVGSAQPEGGFTLSRKALTGKSLVEVYLGFDGLGAPDLAHHKRGRPFGLPRGRSRRKVC